MEELPKKSNFQIVLESEKVEENSTYWQKKCSILYYELHKNLISSSIEPMIYECENGGKADVGILFNILLVTYIT